LSSALGTSVAGEEQFLLGWLERGALLSWPLAAAPCESSGLKGTRRGVCVAAVELGFPCESCIPQGVCEL